VLAGVTLATSGWAFVLLGRSADFLPWLRWAVLAAGLAGAIALLAGHWVGARMTTVAAVIAIVASLAGPTAYTLQTVTTAHTGSIVTAGPAVAGGMGGIPGGIPGGFRGAMPGAPGGPGGTQGTPGARPTPPGGTGTLPGTPPTQGGTVPGGLPGGLPGGMPDGGGGMGGLLNGSKVGAAVTTLLLKDADSYTWVAATVGANNASSYQLATEKSVMPIGGFSGSDPSPTLAQFKAHVVAGQVHYFIGGNELGRVFGGSNVSSQISAWVKATFTAKTVGGATLYDLTQPKASGSTSGTATATS
jgi:hypothetical protein